MIGVANGDTVIFDYKSQTFGQIQIPLPIMVIKNYQIL